MKSNVLSDLILRKIRVRAKEYGYALAVHGSLQRDIDLIAVPWADDAKPPEELAEAIRSICQAMFGAATDTDRIGAANPDYFRLGQPGHKAHGRLCWTFHLEGGAQVCEDGGYIDLSITPLLTREECDARFSAAVERMKEK